MWHCRPRRPKDAARLDWDRSDPPRYLVIERGLKDAFPGIAFAVHGTPKDLDCARDVAFRDKYQFQWWSLSLIEAQPFAGKKKGADGGIDGLIYFRSDARTTERAIVSVKGGDNVSVPMVRDLKGVLERERAPIGIFLTLVPPTRPMEAEAASAGFYESNDSNRGAWSACGLTKSPPQ